MKKIILSALCISAVLCTSCGFKESSGNSAEMIDAAATETAVAAEAEKTILSEAYIAVPEDEEYAVLYSAPDAGSSAVAQMHHGDIISIYKLQDDWYNIKYNEFEGYVQAMYISMAEPPAVTEPVTEAPTEAKTEAKAELMVDVYGIAQPEQYNDYTPSTADTGNGWCSAESCYIYKEPSSYAAKREADMLYYGDSVNILGSVGGYYYISTNGGSGYDITGYVPESYITIGFSTDGSNNSYYYSATAGYVTANSCSVRSTPSKETNSNVIDYMSYGDSFDILDYTGYWFYVRYDGGKTGYISYKMVDVW